MLFSLLIFLLSVCTSLCQEENAYNFVQGSLVGHEIDKQIYDLWFQAEIHIINAPDSALIYAQQCLVDSRQNKFAEGEGLSTLTIAKVFINIGNYSKALETALQSLSILERLKIQSEIAINLYFIGEIFNLQGDYRESLTYDIRAESITETINEKQTRIKILSNTGYAYEKLKQLDSALLYARQSYDLCDSEKDKFVIGGSANLVGEVYLESGLVGPAMDYYRKSILYSSRIKDNLNISNACLGIAKIFKKESSPDSCLFYCKQALGFANSGGFMLQVLNACNFLADFYKEKKEFDSAFVYQQLSIAAKDSIFSLQKIMQFQNISFSEQMRQQELKDAEIRYRNRISIYILFAAVAAILIVAIILWRNNRQKQRANNLLNKQKAEIEFQKAKTENTLEVLQSTQAQLVHAEKMASLGELTAGIAHEIQNPLNFVNNFSELNKELINELVLEAEKGNIDEIKLIAGDIRENEQKINHHGKRADSIVKGMLQHSRKSNGQKEFTDINALTDEFLRLSYHGVKSSMPSPIVLLTAYDETAGKIKIIPQDIGRVFLNLYNNAFYAVAEKKRASLASDAGGVYEPTVSVTTKKTTDRVIITIRDNGIGIPQRLIDKIFQPFFTTKPTGQGTGLGLSLSYDIIKTHGGEIKVASKQGEYSEFTVQLPVLA